MTTKEAPLRFGAFVAPFHALREDPTLTIERDLQLGVLLDELDYDEIWYGEHHSAGIETIGSPELMIAALAERTKHIRMGTGVNSLSYHHPLILADRICQLDHQTRGRIMFGAGPGQLPSDAFMLGISPVDQRRMMGESLEVMMALFRGETVTRKTDWFTLNEARLHLLPYQHPTMEICVASAITPSGPTIAGRLGTGMLSMAAATPAGFDAMRDQWAICEEAASASGAEIDRKNWRVLSALHVAPTREQAIKEVEWGIMDIVHAYRQLLAKQAESQNYWSVANARDAVNMWMTEGLGASGVGIIGTPDDAVEQIERLRDQSGGFGSLLVSVQNIPDFAATRSSFEMIARYVRPRIRGSNRNREASLAWANANGERFVAKMLQGMKQAIEEHGRDPTKVSGWGGKVTDGEALEEGTSSSMPREREGI